MSMKWAPEAADDGHRAAPAFAREIASVLILKLLFLAWLWFAFVQGRATLVDAQRTAEAFGVAHFSHISAAEPRGDNHGQ